MKISEFESHIDEYIGYFSFVFITNEVMSTLVHKLSKINVQYP